VPALVQQSLQMARDKPIEIADIMKNMAIMKSSTNLYINEDNHVSHQVICRLPVNVAYGIWEYLQAISHLPEIAEFLDIVCQEEHGSSVDSIHPETNINM